MIHKSVLDKVARCNGPLEGEHAMWVQTKAGTSTIQWAGTLFSLACTSLAF